MAVLATLVIIVLALTAAAFHSYVIKESPIDAVALSLAPPPNLEGVYARNTLLQSAEKIGTGKVLQPEDIVADPSGKFLYVGTSDGWSRISKYYLKGDNKGKIETLNENLPGFPDNIQYNAKGDIVYVAIMSQRDAILNLLWKLPFVKSLLALYPSLQKVFDTAMTMAGVLAINENGNPLKWYQDPTGKTVGYITSGAEVDGNLYIGDSEMTSLAASKCRFII